MKIEFITNRSGIYGGLRRLYIVAQYLIEAGHEVVVNIADKSNNTWFKHNVPENKSIDPDIRIVPEVLQEKHPKAKNILYYQAHWDDPVGKYDRVITTSLFLQSELKKENYDSQLIRYGLDTNIFKLNNAIKKPKTIAYMPRKNKSEADLIKQLLPNEQFIAIDGKTELETANLLQQSDIFLALSPLEGVGLPVIEAALCGALVIGYHGFGGLDWMNETTYVPSYDPHNIVENIQDAINLRRYDSRRETARSKILELYSMEKEKEEWLKVIHSI